MENSHNGIESEDVYIEEERKPTLILRVLNFFIGKLDSYGGQIDGDPGFKVLLIVMVVVAFYKIIISEKSSVEGNLIVLNMRDESDNQNDFPHLVIAVDNRIVFFETEAPSIQRIEVIDRSGLKSVPHYTSNDKVDGDPETIAVYKSIEVPINSYDAEISFVENVDYGAGTLNMKGMHNEHESHNYVSESLKAIKTLEYGYESYNMYFEHTMSAFVRFKRDQIKKIKSCQLQVVMVNEYEYEMVSYDAEGGLRNMSNHNRLTSKVEIENLWTNENFDDQTGKIYETYNTYVLKKHYTRADLVRFVERNLDLYSESEFDTAEDIVDNDLKYHTTVNDWRLLINYANNFVNIASQSSSCVRPPWWWKDATLAYNSIGTGTTLTFPAEPENYEWLEYCNSQTQTTPFFILVQNHNGKEEMQVTDIDGDCETGITFTVDRSMTPENKRIDFSEELEVEFSDVPDPDLWSCNPGSFANFDEHKCHCNCGQFDPICLETALTSEACLEDEICSFAGSCTGHWAAWLFEDETDSDKVVVSDRCDKMLQKGVKYFSGTLGADPQKLNECMLCPFESIYNNEPQKDEESEKYVCNYLAKGTVDPLRINPEKTFTAGEGMLDLNVTLFKGSPFPIVDEEYWGEPITVLLGTEQATLESSGTKRSEGDQFVRLRSQKGLRPMLEQISISVLYSSISMRSKTFLLKPPSFYIEDIDEEFFFTFPESDFPYTLTTQDGYQVKVSGMETFYSPNLHTKIQRGTFTVYPEFEYGVRLKIRNGGNVGKGDTDFNITLSSEDTLNRDAIPQTPFFLLVEDEDEQKTEIVEVIDIVDYSQWYCDYSEYDARDGVCNCDCGRYDPDCGMPTPKLFAQEKGWVENCEEGEYCSYPQGLCTGTAPIYDEPIKAAPIAIGMTLAHGFEKGHDVGTLLHYFDLDNEITVRRIVPLKLFRSSKEKEFDPSQRYLSQSNEDFVSPEKLEVEVGMFLAPDRPTYEEATLCPTLSIKNSNKVSTVYKNWELHDHMRLNISCRNEFLDVLPTNQSECKPTFEINDEDLGDYCAEEMPPVKELEFTVTLPVSHRFKEMKDTSGTVERQNYVFDSETLFDFEEVFSFPFNQKVEEIESKFAVNKQQGGDVCYDTRGNMDLRRFFGALEYRGKGNGTNEEYRETVPASVPYLFTTFSLRLHDDAYEMIGNWKEWYGKGNRAALEIVFQSLEDFYVTWDFGSEGKQDLDSVEQKIVLIPGHAYTLSVKIQVVPFYSDSWRSLIKNIPPFNLIDTFYPNYIWYYRLSVLNQEMKKEEFEGSNNVRIRYKVELDGKVRQIKEKRDYTITSLLSDIGSALALSSIGLVVLKLWQSTLQKNVKYIDLKEKQLKMLRKKAVKQAKKLDKEIKEKIVGDTHRIEVVPNTRNMNIVEVK